MIRTFAFGVLLTNIISNKSVAGVSLKMLQLYVIVFACRLASILFYEGYLPFDSSGDFLYRGMEIISFLLCLAIVIIILTMHKATYDSVSDSFGNFLMVPSFLGIVWVILPAFLLALIFHPSLNSNMITDVSWTFALAIESMAILPQIIMFIKSLKAAQKKGEAVQTWVSHVLSCLGLARMIHLLFWISSYTELNDKFNSSPGGSHVGHFVVFSQCVQLLLMCDYLYYYVKALYSGGDVTEQLQSNWASSGRSADEFA
jgi:ER lumen protein retaining receptor